MKDRFLEWSLALIVTAVTGFVAIKNVPFLFGDRNVLRPQQVQGSDAADASQEADATSGNRKRMEP